MIKSEFSITSKTYLAKKRANKSKSNPVVKLHKLNKIFVFIIVIYIECLIFMCQQKRYTYDLKKNFFETNFQSQKL